MADWTKIISSHHAAAHAHDGFRLVTNPPASESKINDAAKSLGIAWPAEFVELYLTYDGWGAEHPHHADTHLWFCMPLEGIVSSTETIRSWFSETHESESARFFPFVDFGTGDAIGYLTDESGSVIEGLCIFQHEVYEFDEDQDVDEFLCHAPITLEQYLLQSV